MYIAVDGMSLVVLLVFGLRLPIRILNGRAVRPGFVQSFELGTSVQRYVRAAKAVVGIGRIIVWKKRKKTEMKKWKSENRFEISGRAKKPFVGSENGHSPSGE